MDNYDVILVKENFQLSIKQLVGSLSWESDIDTLATNLKFDFARNRKDLNFKIFDILEIGDKVILLNYGVELFRGIIVNVDWNEFKKSVTCFDYGFYLNTSKTIKQFYNIQAYKAISELCSEIEIPIGNIETMNTNINKIYKNKTISEIINDILILVTNETNIKYRIEMEKGKLNIVKYEEIEINDTVVLGEISKSENIQDMKNSILVSSNEQENTRIIQSTKDEESINKFGVLQDVIMIDDFNESQTNNVAKNKLKELNKIKKEISVTVLGNDKYKAGKIIRLKNDIFDIDGKYLIKNASHSYNNSIHKCTLILEVI